MIRIPHRESNPKVSELKKLHLFSGLSTQRLRFLAQNLDEVQVPKGERFMTEGHGNDAFWIILDGKVELTVGHRIHEVLERGDVAGLPSMFTRRESTADAEAVTSVRALVASHAQFSTLISDAEIEIRFKAAMFDRLRDEVFQLTHGETPPKAKSNAKVRTPRVKP